jgi:uncharacterized membrane protein YcaP (DUF421 family)
MEIKDLVIQCILAFGYYIALVVLIRLAGKRLAGQTTTFDLLVLISLGVTLQDLTLNEGRWNSAVFIATVFSLHVGLARASARWPILRKILREEPRPVIRKGRFIQEALKEEGLTEDEVLAALRKLGYGSPDGLDMAVLEETGHISALPREKNSQKK